MPPLSVVIPARNEAGNIGALIDEIVAALAPLGSFEVIVVDDGSTDDTARELAVKAATIPSLRVLRHPVSAGQSAAIHSGVRAAKGEIVCMLDGDGQNPPAFLPGLISPLQRPGAESVGLVAGQRQKRQDTWSRKAASRFANGLRSWLLNDGTRDTGCGLKAFRRDAYLALPYFDHMHRYLPALFARDGWTVELVDVGHRPRGAGRSNYSNYQRALVGIFDLMGVMWLIRRRKKSAPVALEGQS